ncbi:hypothetical protein N0B44_15415 [Roseibacterium beibuensis]|uniref:Lipoprotein n=1 Tax=[Roseibacterium] beibuensis TaxID=1193142 RepID=A0ABP9L9M1_9RHOB|nr:hypothetical protein [Roseibacterium beibuensis]MCS6624307.1 hypothetical protein [Roseibacterium beibuensis]
MTSKLSLRGAVALAISAFALTACQSSDDARLIAIGEDTGVDSGSLSQLEAGIYIDPDGCHIWMIDDGLEGYWSRRLDPVSGLPVCTDIAPPNYVVGDISRNPGIPDFTPGF